MKKLITKMDLCRPADGLLPLALLVAAALNRSSQAFALAAAVFAVRVLALSSSTGLRVAFALQPSYRKVRGSMVCAFLLQILGGILAAGLGLWLLPGHRADIITYVGAGTLLNIEHLFYEYMYAIGDNRSALLSRTLTSVLTAAGLLLLPAAKAVSGTEALPLLESAPDEWRLLALPVTCGLAALASAIIGTTLGEGVNVRMNARVIQCAPRALIQTVLYPAAAVALLRWALPATAWTPLFAGLILYELCRTPFRRSSMEAGPLNRALLIAAGAALVVGAAAYFAPLPAWPVIVDLVPLAACVLLACVCAASLYTTIINKNKD